MHFDADRVRQNARVADTDDLLDRVTVYREGMEPEALDLIEEELRARGVTPAQIAAHARQRQGQVLRLPDGTAAVCSFCRRPAVAEGWGWHWLLGLLPIFPRRFFYCLACRRGRSP
ncbi:MAG TPA: hypothetical protein VNK04_00650 [Gemmataceae bacterium]|jgi:hypothetical protein|nr:hypothetical protein [Gemmataceae bacterium]